MEQEVELLKDNNGSFKCPNQNDFNSMKILRTITSKRTIFLIKKEIFTINFDIDFISNVGWI